MVSDSIGSAWIPMVALNPKDFAKKKRVNRSAKLKQCKLDARREQWLSQVKNKGCKEGSDRHGGFYAPTMHGLKESGRPIDNFDTKCGGEGNGRLIHHYCDSDSPSDSPISHSSSVSGRNVSGPNFTCSIGSSSSSGSRSGSITGEDEEQDDGCLDDWEAVADALAATGDKQEQNNSGSELLEEHENVAASDSAPKPKTKHELVEMVQRAPNNGQAWKPDDTSRPQSLPSLSKLLSFPMNSGQHHGHGGIAWGCCKNVLSAPSLCPIRCEDLDFTDSSFLPCLCGFRLCLFCHKRILEEDGRCPGCRKQYHHDAVEGEATKDGGTLTFRLARAYSMITRS